MRKVILFALGLFLMLVALVTYACCRVASEADQMEVFER